MKTKKIVSLLFFLFPLFFMAGEARRIDQLLIAKNIDGTMSDFSFFYHNASDSDLLVDAFFTGCHYVSFRTEKKEYRFEFYTDPGDYYTISPGYYFLNYNIYQESEIENEIKKQKNPVILSWNIFYESFDVSYHGTETAKIYLSGDINSNMDFFHKEQKDCVFAEIIKLMDSNHFSFALLLANHTSEKIVLTDLYGDKNQVKLKFPNGGVFTPPLKKDAKSVELKPGESKSFPIDLKELLKESKDFSMKDFEYGLTELVWEIKLNDGKSITRNFWFVKFNGELPEAHSSSGYKLDGPLTLETFRDKKISALPPSKAYLWNKEKGKLEPMGTIRKQESTPTK